ncbi:MAG: cysteine--tRNA ligase [Candidatus Hydrogenedentota bacterium]|nr:MAG: cysteine--tRNA ligase [Candidatus Hydrogenedentota bacterium]
MKIFNALTGEKEVFTPHRPGEVRMYVCGMTVSDDIHLGHARSAAAFDLFRRVFEFHGWRVLYVRNITDIDDKIIERGRKEGRDPAELAEYYRQRHEEDLERLRVPRANVEPKASEHIPEMIRFAEELVRAGLAVVRDGGVYFNPEKISCYGCLARRRNLTPERTEVPLWKPSRKDEPGWDSPWGRGRPGWHIECSTMARVFLGDVFDIHGGGEDLLHPHHDTEIAQSAGLTGKIPANFFLHNGLVYLPQESRKMSKSLGNVFTLREIFAQFDPAVVRHYLFSRHYREPMTFRLEDLERSRVAVDRLEGFLRRSAAAPRPARLVPEAGERVRDVLKSARVRFLEALEDDLDTVKALNVVEDVLAAGEEYLESGSAEPRELVRIEELIEEFDELLDLRPEGARTHSPEAVLIEEILKIRGELRRSESEEALSLARRLEEVLENAGIEFSDTAWGTRWKWRQYE